MSTSCNHKVLCVLVAASVLLNGLWYLRGTTPPTMQSLQSTRLQMIDSLSKEKIVQGVLKVLSNVEQSKKLSCNSTARQLLMESYGELSLILKILDVDTDRVTVSNAHTEVDTITITEATASANTSTSNRDVGISKNQINNTRAPTIDVCPEHYTRTKQQTHFPYWDRGGFVMENCTGVPEFYTLITLVYNFVHYDSKYYQLIPKIFHDVQKLYPKVRVVAAIPETLTLDEKDFINTTLQTFSNRSVESTIWTQLISKVRTKYVYIGRDVVRITWFDRLERLVREINNLEASVVASAYRTWKGGEWSNGCEQSVLLNYQLTYIHGYEVSMEECLLCHHANGPFVAKRKLFDQIKLTPTTSSVSLFAIWFLRLKKNNHIMVSCPDAMAFVTDESHQPTVKEDWKPLALFFQVEKIHRHNNKVFEFSCGEAQTTCGRVRAAGNALSACCMRKLSNLIKLTMNKCQEGGFLCILDSGTLLGALKFNSVLPWELDSDITIHPDNFTAFGKKYQSYFESLGYKWKHPNAKSFKFNDASWKMEVYRFRYDEELRVAMGLSPTVIEFDGEKLRTSESPGLQSRNRYGGGIYQHVQHWYQWPKNTKRRTYDSIAKKFNKCRYPGHHACLDQFKPDGNIKLRVN